MGVRCFGLIFLGLCHHFWCYFVVKNGLLLGQWIFFFFLWIGEFFHSGVRCFGLIFLVLCHGVILWWKMVCCRLNLVLCEKYSYMIWRVGSWHYFGLFARMLNCVRNVIFDLALWDFLLFLLGITSEWTDCICIGMERMYLYWNVLGIFYLQEFVV